MSLKRSYQHETGMILMKEDEMVGYVYNRYRGDLLPAAFSMADEFITFLQMVQDIDNVTVLQHQAKLLQQQLDWTQEEIAHNR